MLSRRVLQSIKSRWERDLAQLEAAYGQYAKDLDGSCSSETETVRNLATAIVHIDELITGEQNRDQ